ncbi:MAG: FKBP-type peptidyl-prolyl cis-trans isomerase [Patescibacteria group bacterium]
MVRGKKILIIVLLVILIGITILAVKNLKTPSLRGSGSGETVTDVPENISGLGVEVLQYGTGDRKVQSGDYILIRYEGKLQDGTVFASNLEQAEPSGFYVGKGETIKGWDKGLIGMRENEKRKLTISPELAYGSFGSDGVPANATLTYEIHLLDIVE